MTKQFALRGPWAHRWVASSVFQNLMVSERLDDPGGRLRTQPDFVTFPPVLLLRSGPVLEAGCPSVVIAV